MIIKKCDACKKEVDTLIDLLDIYQTEEVKHVCEKCLGKLAKKYKKINEEERERKITGIKAEIHKIQGGSCL